MASYHLLHEGYVRERDDNRVRVGSTVAYVRDGDAHVVIDPGLVASPDRILGPLGDLGVRPGDITDIVLSHHHPDHTLNVALFPGARVHDHWAVYEGDLWISRCAEGFAVSPDVELWKTPGHTPEDITTLVRTDEGLVAFTHCWWTAEGPVDDPYAPDRDVLRASRERVLAVADLVVPGHGAPFVPSADTPR